jgi:hypothetical protein
MTEYIDMNTGEKLRDKECAEQAYAAGHRIRVDSDGVTMTEWIPGSNASCGYEGGEKSLHRWKHERWNEFTSGSPCRR